MLTSLNAIARNMAEYFDPSPRASKRRRTATPKRLSSTQEKENEISSDEPRTETSQDIDKDVVGVEDSAYGSKEDSLIEDQPSILPAPQVGEEMTLDDDEHDKSTMTRTGRNLGRSSKRKEVTPPPDGAEAEDDDEDTISVQPRSSGRERRKPRRYSLSPEQPRKRKTISARDSEKKDMTTTSAKKLQSPVVKNTPKGILTPSRREKRVGGPRKSVNFGQSEKEIEEQFGFRDIQSSKGLKSRSSKQELDQALEDAEVVDGTPSKKGRYKESFASIPPLDVASDPEDEDQDLVIQDIIEEPSITIPEVQAGISAGDWTLEDDSIVLQIKSEVLTRLTSRGSPNGQVSPHLQNQYDTLHALLHATVTSGESNSLLLLGARGTGKTHLLQTAIADLNKTHSNDFHVVRLNGFCQTDDKVALREIWRQLGREMQVDEMETGETGGSYADTMSSLLSLLSHPDEFGESITTEENAMEVDKQSIRTSKSIIFVMDEFDLFTTHPRQTLLYNLFDIAQSKKAPIAVVGCSTRMDVVDCLEKRVKSRFSHRWLHIPSAKTLDGFEAIVKSILCVEDYAGIAATKILKKDPDIRKRWNHHIESTFLSSGYIQALIKSSFYTTKSIPDLLAVLFLPVAHIQLPSSDSIIDTVFDTTHTSIPPSVLRLLSSLPTLQLSLLIAAARLDTIHNLTTLNFNLVYAHYVELISRSKIQITAAGAVAVGASMRQWDRDTARCAWEDLGVLECVVPVSGAVGVGAGGKETSSISGDSIGGEGANVRMWRVDVTLEEIEWAVKERWSESGGVRDMLLKWCKEI